MATDLSLYDAAAALAKAAALHREAVARADRSRDLLERADRRVAASKVMVAVGRHAVAASRLLLATPAA